jgi:hypothetical protein
MRMLKHFESFEPNQEEVNKLINFLSMAYPLRSSNILDSESKFVMIDDKPFYIKGKYSVNKSRLVDALSFELEEHFPLFSEASIRKAAKDFFEFHSK